MQCLQPNRPRREFAAEWTRKDWGKDPNQHWLKVTEAETGDMAAAALWTFHPEKQKSKEVPPPADIQIEEAAIQEVPESEKLQKSFYEELGRMSKEFKDEFIGTRPHACEYPYRVRKHSFLFR